MGWKAVKEHYRIDHDVQVVAGKGICIGSAYVHDLITVSLSGEVRPGRIVRRGEPGKLGRYMDEMDADPAKLRELIEQPDHFERSIQVFTYDGAEIIECACEELGWPNVTHDGRMMYENMFSADRAEVVEWAISNARAGIENWTDIVRDREDQLREANAALELRKANLAALLENEHAK